MTIIDKKNLKVDGLLISTLAEKKVIKVSARIKKKV